MLLGLAASAQAQTGKISGRVTDEGSASLPGVNISIDGTTQGAVTDVEGYYTILNVRPGTYDLRASFIGFSPVVQQGVRVNIDQTTEINFTLREEVAGLDEVVVVAESPVVQRDLSASVANIGAAEVEKLPVASVEEVIGLQAGTEGLLVRGGGLEELGYLVDGFSTRVGRNNSSATTIPLTAIQEVKVQTGGFNAEYGNVRSGLISVALKEGPRRGYIADALVRYAPAEDNYFGMRPDDPGAYWMRPYLDPEVAFVGTSAWDPYTANQYPVFKGFNQAAADYNKGKPADKQVTPEQLQQAFRYYTRRSLEPSAAHYEVDATLGGPLPILGPRLGDLRFMASYRQSRDPYTIPMRREAFDSRVGLFKVTSNLRENIKVNLQGIISSEAGMVANDEGDPGILRGQFQLNPNCYGGPTGIPIECNGRPPAYGNDSERGVLFSPDVLGVSDINTTLFGLDLTHTLGPRTFYEVQVQRSQIDYLTRPGAVRDTTTRTVTFDGAELPFRVDEAPFGYFFGTRDDPFTGTGLPLSRGQWINGRDSSKASYWSGRFDLTHQMNRFAQIKGGLEYVRADYNTRQYDLNPFTPPGAVYLWQRQPVQAAAYGQTKLEFKGMVANLGLRLDYYHSGGDWYDFAAFDPAFSSAFGYSRLDEVLDREPTERKLYLSPRVGIAFPVTQNSKLYLNYGHFRSFVNPTTAFNIRANVTNNEINRIGNPNLPLPQTVMYELGYEHNLFNQFLVRAAGYYRATENEPRGVTLSDIERTSVYTTYFADHYEDVRGIELTLSKNRGAWVQGFVNYTYMSFKGSNFGFGQYYESRREQIELERTAFNAINPADPRPYVNFNVALLLPTSFGPSLGGAYPLGDWRISFLGFWRTSQAFTWNGGQGGIQEPGLVNNVRWTPERRLDLRLSKNFGFANGRGANFFADVTNVLNLRRLYANAFAAQTLDYDEYMQSLHLPADVFGDYTEQASYRWIPGSDQPGDYRDPDAEFTPIEIVDALPGQGLDLRARPGVNGPLYYVPNEGQYYVWNGNAFQAADKGFVDDVMDKKAYIDMPNEEYYWFLNPRRVRIGLRLTF